MQKQKLSGRQLKKIKKSEKRTQSEGETEEAIQFLKETALREFNRIGRGVIVVDLSSVNPVATYLPLSCLEAMDQPLQNLTESVRAYNPETQCVISIGSYQNRWIGEKYVVCTWNQQEENFPIVQPMHQIIPAVFLMWCDWTGQIKVWSVKIKFA
jgi:hypothetical protein